MDPPDGESANRRRAEVRHRDSSAQTLLPAGEELPAATLLRRAGPSGARRTVVQFAFGLAVVTYLDRVCISVAAPFMMAELKITVLQMSAVFSAFTLAYSIFEVPSGWLGDVRGARSVLTRIVCWWSAFTILTGAARSYLSLLAIRFMFGAGEAGAFPNMSRAISRWLPPLERGWANGVLFLGSRLGGALAPLLAVVLIQRWGWRASFVGFGAVGFFWAAAWHRWFRDDPSQHPAVSAEELSCIREAAGAPEGPAGATGGTQRIPWRRIVTSRSLVMTCLMYFAFGYGLYFYFTWLPMYLIRELGFTGIQGGLLAGLPFLLAGAADLFGGWLSDRLARSRGLRVARSWLGSAAFFGSSLLLLASTSAQDRTAKAILIALALASADLALSAAWAVCLDIGRDYAGVVTGFMNTFGNLGGFLGPLVAGFAIERWNSWTVPFHIAAAVYAAGGVFWLLVDPNDRI